MVAEVLSQVLSGQRFYSRISCISSTFLCIFILFTELGVDTFFWLMAEERVSNE